MYRSQIDHEAKRRVSGQTNDSMSATNRAPKPSRSKNQQLVHPISIVEATGFADLSQPIESASACHSGDLDSLDFNAVLRRIPLEPNVFSPPGEQPNLPSSFGIKLPKFSIKDLDADILTVNVSQNDLGAVLPTGSAVSRLERPLKANMGVVIYSHYRFLTAGNIHAIPHQDVSYLEAQGCLHVPTPPILDVFMSKYFAHVHVFLPLIDEGDFWDMYSQSSQSLEKDTMSLIVLHAMLFASSNVSHSYDLWLFTMFSLLTMSSLCLLNTLHS